VLVERDDARGGNLRLVVTPSAKKALDATEVLGEHTRVVGRILDHARDDAEEERGLLRREPVGERPGVDVASPGELDLVHDRTSRPRAAARDRERK
jgi:hypothetical protein